MRAVMVLLAALLVLPGVFAVGISTSSSVLKGFSMDVGDEKTVSFMLKGETNRQDVTFFVQVDKSSGLRAKGLQRYEKAYSLSSFENQVVSIDLSAQTKGEYVVTFGYVKKGGSSGVQMDQVVQDSFKVKVVGDGTVPPPIVNHTNTSGGTSGSQLNVTVGSTPTSGSGSVGSGGSGGGGAYVAPSSGSAASSGVVQKPADSGPVVAQDLSGEGSSSFVEGRVNAGGSPSVSTVVGGQSENGVSSKQGMGSFTGKQALLVVLVIGIVSVLASFGSLVMYGRAFQ